MSQPKRGRSPSLSIVSNEVSPSQPRPRASAALSEILWSAEKLHTILQDDEANDARNKKEFLAPTIVSCLRVGPLGGFTLPVKIDTLLESVDVWWPTPAAALWHGRSVSEGARADVIRAQVRIDSIVGGLNWGFAAHEVSVEGAANNDAWSEEQVSEWTAAFMRRRASPSPSA